MFVSIDIDAQTSENDDAVKRRQQQFRDCLGKLAQAGYHLALGITEEEFTGWPVPDASNTNFYVETAHLPFVLCFSPEHVPLRSKLDSMCLNGKAVRILVELDEIVTADGIRLPSKCYFMYGLTIEGGNIYAELEPSVARGHV